VDREQQRDEAMRIRREIVGERFVDATTAESSEFMADFLDIVTRWGWGEVWGRPGLDRRTRSCVTIGALVALNHSFSLAQHIRIGLQNGLTQDEIKEILIQCSAYCGLPAGVTAFQIAEEVFATHGASPLEEPPG
jgi:3-oxoadipate enol-lactonase/4-carboxymuconolactone decarboxylase